MIRLITRLLILGLMPLGISGCGDLMNPNFPSNNSGYNSGGYDNDYYRREREQDREERQLERERDDLEDERRQLERERELYRNQPRPPTPTPVVPTPVVHERCPSGYSPSERKCTQAERKKGCKDMRLPGGLGCVRR